MNIFDWKHLFGGVQGELIWLLVGLVILTGIVAIISELLFKKPERQEYDYRARDAVMTKAEMRCFLVLEELVGEDFYIFPQLHLPAILDHKVNGQNWRGAFRHIDEKSVDFVLCDKEHISPKLVIELDDWSHAREDRQERDREVERILAYAKLPLLRITDTQDLRSKILAKITN
jgi:very-short-patch-repair endonuclease